MRALTYLGPRAVAVLDHPKPVLTDDEDVIVEVRSSAICGTDLHPYRQHLPGIRSGMTLGHEVMGVISAAGTSVSYPLGTRVVVSDVLACGQCSACSKQHHYHCLAGGLLGYGDVVRREFGGGQAEYVRVPFANTTLLAVPTAMADVEALFAGDILATAVGAVEAARVQRGDLVAVVGCGPVGLLAVQVASVLGARVLAIDPNPARLARAHGADATAHPFDAVAMCLEMGAGELADVAVEAVGTAQATEVAISVLGPGGRVAVVGAHHDGAFPLTLGEAFARELQLSFVVGNPIKSGQRALELVADGTVKPELVVSHHLRLEDAVQGYDLFDRGIATKVVLQTNN